MISAREINLDLGKDIDDEASPEPQAITPGGLGSQWRMMRLRRVYETAEEEGVEPEKIAIERFGSLKAFEEAKEERRILDEREGKYSHRGRATNHQSQNKAKDVGEKRFMFTDIGGSGGSSRSSSFRRPAGVSGSAPSTPSPAPDVRVPQNRRLDSLRGQSGTRSPLVQSHTPIPSVMTPPPPGAGSRSRALSPSSLNKLQAKVLRAKLTGAPDADKLEREYDAQVRVANGGESIQSGVHTKTEVLPTLDGRGRLYDVGHGKDNGQALPGNRKKKDKVFSALATGYAIFSSLTMHSLKLVTQKLATSFVTMPMTMILRWGRCSGRSDLVQVWLTKRILMPNLLERLWVMESSR